MSTVFKRRSVKAYMNDHMKRFHSISLVNHEDCSKPVVIVAKNSRAPTVSQNPMDEALPKPADVGCFEFECTGSSTDMEDIVPSEPGKGERSMKARAWKEHLAWKVLKAIEAMMKVILMTV